MDEIKILLDMVSHLPSMALWVIAGLFAYKVVVIGSIYGIIRLGITKVHEWLMARKTLAPEIKEVIIDGQLNGSTITGCVDSLVKQIFRVRGKGLTIESNYIHKQSVEWLQEAIDDKIEKDAKEGKVWGAEPSVNKSALDGLRNAQQNAAYNSAINSLNSLSGLNATNASPFGV